ncbi:biotin/lipoyl-binding protein [Clostridium subterminale]|uniref:Biotin/lipoyl-binding protein n=1 Tax=Clostridium subterminale TaxID=1550 RepID=A0ABP3W617_CLOSU
MKYIVTMNQKKYEVEVERVSPFHMLTHEEVATGKKAEPVTTPAPVVTPKPTAAPVQTTAPVASSSGFTVNSPMPGTILEVKTAVGQSVKSGQTLFIMEAMKMETEIVASGDGTITSISAKPGDVTETDQVLATLN